MTIQEVCRAFNEKGIPIIEGGHDEPQCPECASSNLAWVASACFVECLDCHSSFSVSPAALVKATIAAWNE